MEENIACINQNGKQCEYRGTWFCNHPKRKGYVLTSTLIGARPSDCPKVDKWNRKD